MIISFPEDSSGILHHLQGILGICLCWDRLHFCHLCIPPGLCLHRSRPPDLAGGGWGPLTAPRVSAHTALQRLAGRLQGAWRCHHQYRIHSGGHCQRSWPKMIMLCWEYLRINEYLSIFIFLPLVTTASCSPRQTVCWRLGTPQSSVHPPR